MILCCGEALIDMIPTASTDGSAAFSPHSGGSVFNTAIALGRLGADVGFLSGVSTDKFGQQLCKDLTASNVNTDHLIRSDRLTTLAMVHLTNGSATYSFYDENSAGRMIGPDDLPAIPDSIQALYFGGISLAAEPAADTYAALLKRESGQRLVMLDPNIRPDFISDERRFRARLNGMMALSDIVKTSDEDLAWLEPSADTIVSQARAILAKGPSLVIVTQGAQGATAIMQDGHFTVPAPTTNVVDTVGAGDTFNAGFLAHLDEIKRLSPKSFATSTLAETKSALAFGAQVAAVTVSRAGANPPWREELN
ncbi:fructokinase [Shimia isoporae]|uniref:Fructokinase n=1 Tax=Shimia isoporae TaxID=647720 RepID=A0A4R1N492_9RHOB|nr:carbohydrate kinase [Shimia isoporae]TCK98904.1 fructokinase [Shimia isoporae]